MEHDYIGELRAAAPITTPSLINEMAYLGMLTVTVAESGEYVYELTGTGERYLEIFAEDDALAVILRYATAKTD